MKTQVNLPKGLRQITDFTFYQAANFMIFFDFS